MYPETIIICYIGCRKFISPTFLKDHFVRDWKLRHFSISHKRFFRHAYKNEFSSNSQKVSNSRFVFKVLLDVSSSFSLLLLFLLIAPAKRLSWEDFLDSPDGFRDSVLSSEIASVSMAFCCISDTFFLKIKLRYSKRSETI